MERRLTAALMLFARPRLSRTEGLQQTGENRPPLDAMKPQRRSQSPANSGLLTARPRGRKGAPIRDIRDRRTNAVAIAAKQTQRIYKRTA